MAKRPTGHERADEADENVVVNEAPQGDGDGIAEQDPNASDPTVQTAADSDPGDVENDEQAEPDHSGETPAPSDEALDAIDEIEAAQQTDADKAISDAEEKFLKLAAAFPSTTPDSHTFGGFGGIRIELGDIRNLAVGIKRKYRG